MSLGDLMIQEYLYEFYRPGTTTPDTNICLIQPYLEILYSPFSSTKLLTLELLLPPSGTPMNINILYDPIFSIPYIHQLPSTSPIYDQFTMDNLSNNYVIAIDNEDPSLDTTDVQRIQDKQKGSISSSVIITDTQQRPSALTSLK